MVAVDVSTWSEGERSRGVSSRESSPLGSEASARGRAVVEQDLELTRGQRVKRRGASLRPPPELASREPFDAEPKAVAVVDEELDGGSGTVSKNENGAREGVGVELFAAQGRERIDALAEIDRLDADEDLELGDKLDHACEDKNAHQSRSRSSRSASGRASSRHAPSVR